MCIAKNKNKKGVSVGWEGVLSDQYKLRMKWVVDGISNFYTLQSYLLFYFLLWRLKRNESCSIDDVLAPTRRKQNTCKKMEGYSKF